MEHDEKVYAKECMIRCCVTAIQSAALTTGELEVPKEYILRMLQDVYTNKLLNNKDEHMKKHDVLAYIATTNLIINSLTQEIAEMKKVGTVVIEDTVNTLQDVDTVLTQYTNVCVPEDTHTAESVDVNSEMSDIDDTGIIDGIIGCDGVTDAEMHTFEDELKNSILVDQVAETE